MNNKLVVALVAGVIAVVGITYYAMTHKKDSDDMLQDDTQNSTTELQSNDNSPSIKDLMAQGATLRCEYTDDQNQTTVAYVKGSNVRATIQNPINKNDPSNFLLLDTTLYMWPTPTSSKQGYTVTVDEETLQRAQQQVQGAGDVDKATNTDVIGLLEHYKQNCKTASVQDSEFVKPTNITFQDFSKVYQGTK